MTLESLMEEAEPIIEAMTRKYEHRTWGTINDIDDMRQFIRVKLLEKHKRKAAPQGWLKAHLITNIRWMIAEFLRKYGSLGRGKKPRKTEIATSSMGDKFEVAEDEATCRVRDVPFDDLIELASRESKVFYADVLRVCGLKNQDACEIAGIQRHHFLKAVNRDETLDRIRELIQ